MREHNNLVITGFMGTGKSAVGRLVANRLGRDFVDTDQLIEERAGRSIPEIFQRDGESRFRELEMDLCRELSVGQKLVIASGGWTLGPAANRAAVEAGGLAICLKGQASELVKRLGGAEGRPMLDDQAWQSRLENLLAERRPVYDAFPFQVDTSRLSMEEVADRVLALWEAFADEEPPTALPVFADRDGYAVLIGDGLLDRVGPLVNGLGRWPMAVHVSDSTVAPLYADQLSASLERAAEMGRGSLGRVSGCTMPAGESNKRLTAVSDFYSQFLDAGLDRSGLVLALGGGVVGDVSGFAAATFMRGLPLVQIPTTLLAMVDSSVGGKTGVDLPAGKNLVGAFKQPILVAIDPTVLSTLSDLDFRSGLAETIKAGVIGSPALFERLERGDLDDMAWIIREAVSVKIEVVESDPYERGRRAVLNLGHTFAHALELLSDFQLAHGQAVAIGMMVAARLAAKLDRCGPELVGRIEAAMQKLQLPTQVPAFEPDAIWEAMASDKKKQGKHLRFVLPLDIGRVEMFDDIPREAVMTVLESCQQAE